MYAVGGTTLKSVDHMYLTQLQDLSPDLSRGRQPGSATVQAFYRLQIGEDVFYSVEYGFIQVARKSANVAQLRVYALRFSHGVRITGSIRVIVT